MTYYPIFLDLRGRRCVVIGGGRVAEGKVRGLLDAGAEVVVIAPSLTDTLQEWAEKGRFRHISRRYRCGDLTPRRGAKPVLVISATDDPTVNEQVWQEAGERDIPLNTVDAPSRCSFIVPSLVRRGDLCVAVSTGGKAPALAVRLRQQIERIIGDEQARFLDLVGTIREPLMRLVPDLEERRKRWYRLMDSDALDLLRKGDEPAARARIVEIMGVVPTGPNGDHDEAQHSLSSHDAAQGFQDE